jgi:hypothetical protein
MVLATTKKPKQEKICIICGETKSSSPTNNKFYNNRNKFINEKFGICKECVEKIGLTNNLEDIHLLLRLMDLPFVPEKWDDCTAQENTLITYMGNKGINLPKVKYNNMTLNEMHYIDSPNFNQVNNVLEYLMVSSEEKMKNIERWGEAFNDAECYKMNKSVENNIKVTGRDDYQSIKSFERLARAEIQVDRAYANQVFKPTDIKSAEDSLNSIMKQAGLAFEQLTKTNSDSTLGTDIRDVIENYEPVPEAIAPFDDVDSIGKYITRFLMKPLLRSVGKDNSEIKDDYEEIKSEIKDRKNKWLNKNKDETDENEDN